MRKLIALIAIAAAPLAPEAAFAAQASPSAQSEPNITVEGNRIVCRRIVRTASRMGSGRVCHTQAEWRAHPGGSAAADNSRTDIEDAANALDMYGEKVSTNCTGGMGGGHDGPLGPR